MDRQGNNLFFTQEEQLTFSVPESVPVQSALETASVFLKTAETLIERASEIPDSTNADQVAKYKQRAFRATQLLIFSHGILKLCSREVIGQLIDP